MLSYRYRCAWGMEKVDEGSDHLSNLILSRVGVDVDDDESSFLAKSHPRISNDAAEEVEASS